CHAAQIFVHGGQRPVTEQLHPEFVELTLQRFLAFLPHLIVSWEKHDSHSVFAKRRELESQLKALVVEKLMGHLDQNARAVPGVLLAPARAPMIHTLQHMKCIVRSEEHTSELQSRENLVCR